LEGSKQFFIEKKHQKTFARLVPHCGWLTGRLATLKE
jgi:hypothetical protein